MNKYSTILILITLLIASIACRSIENTGTKVGETEQQVSETSIAANPPVKAESPGH